MLCRSPLEMSLFWLYENDSDFEMPYNTSINSLLHTDSFRDNIRASVRQELNAVRLLGNIASHASKGNAVKRKEEREQEMAEAAKETSIRNLASIDYWQEISLQRIDNIRKDIRNLVHLLKEENNIKPIYTKLDDNLMKEDIVEYNIIANFANLQSYKDRGPAFRNIYSFDHRA